MNNLEASQNKIIELEDDLILVSKWKREMQMDASSCGISSSKAIIQKILNEIIALKMKFLRVGSSF